MPTDRVGADVYIDIDTDRGEVKVNVVSIDSDDEAVVTTAFRKQALFAIHVKVDGQSSTEHGRLLTCEFGNVELHRYISVDSKASVPCVVSFVEVEFPEAGIHLEVIIAAGDVGLDEVELALSLTVCESRESGEV